MALALKREDGPSAKGNNLVNLMFPDSTNVIDGRLYGSSTSWQSRVVRVSLSVFSWLYWYEKSGCHWLLISCQDVCEDSEESGVWLGVPRSASQFFKIWVPSPSASGAGGRESRCSVSRYPPTCYKGRGERRAH